MSSSSRLPATKVPYVNAAVALPRAARSRPQDIFANRKTAMLTHCEHQPRQLREVMLRLEIRPSGSVLPHLSLCYATTF